LPGLVDINWCRLNPYIGRIASSVVEGPINLNRDCILLRLIGQAAGEDSEGVESDFGEEVRKVMGANMRERVMKTRKNLVIKTRENLLIKIRENPVMKAKEITMKGRVRAIVLHLRRRL